MRKTTFLEVMQAVEKISLQTSMEYLIECNRLLNQLGWTEQEYENALVEYLFSRSYQLACQKTLPTISN
jgi:hypothetical protein